MPTSCANCYMFALSLLLVTSNERATEQVEIDHYCQLQANIKRAHRKRLQASRGLILFASTQWFVQLVSIWFSYLAG